MKKYTLLALCTSCLLILFVPVYFEKYWNVGSFLKKERLLHFALLDLEGSIYRFPASLQKQAAFFVFLPDEVEEIKAGFQELLKIKETLRSRDDLELILISRLDGDTLRSLKNTTHYTGKILLDPANSVWGYFQGWSRAAPHKNWRLALIGKDGKVLWNKEARKPLLP